MSGRAKRTLYHVFDAALFVAAVAAAGLLAGFACGFGTLPRDVAYAVAALALSVVLKLGVVLHEAGHLLFGLLAGMKPHAVSVGYLRFEGRRARFIPQAEQRVAGATEMYPMRGTRMRARVFMLAAGGSALNFIVGAIGIALYFALPYHPALLYFAMISAFFLYEGIAALLPAELPAGKTDGAILYGMIRRRAEEDVMLRVFTAQGILYRGTFDDLPAELLCAPVVREDLAAWHSLMLLRAQAALFSGDDGEAEALLSRLLSADGLSEQAKREARRYFSYFSGEFYAADETFAGVRALDERLLSSQKTKKSALQADDTKKESP